MGGILSGLIGGMAKGALGGVTAEGERRRKEDELSKSILTQFHMNRLQDWEKLSPSEQQDSIQGLTKIHPGMGKYLPQLVGIAQAVHPIIQAQMPKQSVEAPQFGQRPADIPFDVQDMRPAPALPAPKLAPGAPMRPVPTMESISKEIGADPNNMSHNQRAMLQAEILKQNQAEQGRQEGEYYKEQAIKNNIGSMQDKLTPDQLTDYEAALRNPTFVKMEQAGTWGAPAAYTDPQGIRHEVEQNNKTRVMRDRTTQQIMASVPPDWLLEAKPRDLAPGMSVGPNNELQYTDVNRVAQDFKRQGNKGPLTKGTGAKVRAGVPTFQPLVGQSGQIEGKFENRTGTITPIEGQGLRKTPVPSGEKTATSNLIASEQKIKNIGALFNPKFVGPVTGRQFDINAKLPDMIRGKIDPKQAEFVASNTVLKNEVIKFITGAQMGEKEAERILQQVPTPYDAPENWQAKYKITLQNVQMLKGMMQQQGFNFNQGSIGAPPSSGNKKLKSGNEIIGITLSPNQ